MDPYADMKFEIVDIKTLKTAAYQRGSISPATARMAKRFDPRKVEAVTLGERPCGDRYIINGLQRRTAAIKAGADRLPAVIWPTVDEKEEAEMFLGISEGARHLTSWDKFKAALVAERSEAIGVRDITEGMGFKIRRSGGTVAWPGISAVDTLQKMYKCSPEHLYNTLTFIKDIWPDTDSALQSRFLGACSKFVRQAENHLYYDQDRARRLFSPRNPNWFVSNFAVSLGGIGGSGTTGVARGMINLYNGRFGPTKSLPQI